MPTEVPVLETERLLLRPPRREDFDSWAKTDADEETMRYIGGHLPRTASWRYFLTVAGAWSIQGFAMFSVLEKASGLWVGRVGPWFPEGWPGTEIGWAIVRDRWGRGYAGEAAAATIDWAFAALGWTEIIHVIDVGNAASMAVARKLGSRDRGPMRLNDKTPVQIFGQTREQWQLRESPGSA